MTENTSTDILVHAGLRRTDEYCHNCNKNFIAQLDYSLEGNHEIECVHCGHIHYRFIKGGKVTQGRYDKDYTTHKVLRRDMWKSTTQPIVTSTASVFIREKWLNFGRE